jgi:hypothetical protein
MVSAVGCNYDSWATKAPKNITPKMLEILAVMKDGKERLRVDMLRAAHYDPNPMSSLGYGGFEKYDYFLYKKGLIEFVREEGGQKVFKITAAGLAAV